MNNLKIIGHVIVTFLLLGCQGAGAPYGYNPNGNAHNDGYPPNNQYASTRDPNRDYDRIRDNDSDRDDILDDSRRRSTGDTCDNKSQDHECREHCRAIYKNRDRGDCLDLSVSQIETLKDIHEELKSPRYDRLNKIKTEDLEVYLNLSIFAFDSLVRNYRSVEAKDVMAWIVDYPKVTDKIWRQDEDYRTLESLLGGITSYTNVELYRPFSTAILRSGDTLFDMAVVAGNDYALDWFQEYIEDQVKACPIDAASTPNCRFVVYCKIGKAMDDERNREQLINDSSSFENYIDDIIRQGVNAIPTGTCTPKYANNSPSSWTSKWNKSCNSHDSDDEPLISSPGDLPNNDFLYLCGGL